MTTADVARELAISPSHARKLIADGVIPSVVISERIRRVYRPTFERWLQSREVAAS
jgi:excisionase family DNA binding protein